ncbi:MAG: hypothetical protein IT427_18805 [Pirellulales bacterium]|nr:hypothetical protein [Pirellulales bacterium]
MTRSIPRLQIASVLLSCLLVCEVRSQVQGATIGPGSGFVLANPPIAAPRPTSSLEVHRIPATLAAGVYTVSNFSFHNATQSGLPAPGSVVPFLAALTDPGFDTTGETRAYQTIWVGPPVAVADVVTLSDPANIVSVSYLGNSQQFSLPVGIDVYGGLFSSGAARVGFRDTLPELFWSRVDHDTTFTPPSAAGQAVNHFSKTFDNAVYAFQISVNSTGGVPTTPGDFDVDGDVDGADFVAWQTHFPAVVGATRAHGDSDGDGDVDGSDFVAWQTHFPFALGLGTAPLPEPAAWAIALCALGGMMLTIRHFK